MLPGVGALMPQATPILNLSYSSLGARRAFGSKKTLILNLFGF